MIHWLAHTFGLHIETIDPRVFEERVDAVEARVDVLKERMDQLDHQGHDHPTSGAHAST